MRYEELSVGQLNVDNILGNGAVTNVVTKGKKLYVDSVHGSDGNDGLTPNSAKATIFGTSGAHALCTASHGDHIFCLPGHVESVIAAAGGAFSKIGVTVHFLGSGASRAKVNFGTGAVVLSDINFSATGVTLNNPLFVSAIDALSTPLHVTAADVTFNNVEWRDAAGLGVTHALVASSAADRLKINGWKYVPSTTGTQKHSNIQLAGGDHIELKNIQIDGDFNVAPIESTAALTNVILENVYVNNTNTGPLPGLNIHSNTTGFAKNVKSRVASGSTYVTSVGKIQWGNDCEGFTTDGYSGDPIGTAVSTGVEGKIDVVDGYFDVPAQSATTNTTVRDVVGNKTDPVRTASSSTVSALSYLKGIVSKITVPAQSATANGFVNDVVGNKTDPARTASSNTVSALSYLKGIIGKITVPAQSATTNAFVNDVVGNKIDPTRTAVSTTVSALSYLKGVISKITVPAQSATANGFVNDVIGNKTDVAKYTAADTLSAMSYLKGLVGVQDAAISTNSRHLAVNALMTSATWNAKTAHEILAVSGTNRIRIIPYCTTGIACSAGGLFRLGDSITTNGLIANTTGVGIDTGEYWFHASSVSNTKNLAYNHVIDVITNLDIGYTITSATTAGNLRFLCWWEPLEAGATVAAGAGGAL